MVGISFSLCPAATQAELINTPTSLQTFGNLISLLSFYCTLWLLVLQAFATRSYNGASLQVRGVSSDKSVNG